MTDVTCISEWMEENNLHTSTHFLLAKVADGIPTLVFFSEGLTAQDRRTLLNESTTHFVEAEDCTFAFFYTVEGVEFKVIVEESLANLLDLAKKTTEGEDVRRDH